jgi:predicted nucleic acid-binding protein
VILVDSSVWVAFFNGDVTRQTEYLHAALGTEPIAVGDLMLVEVLQGFRKETDYRRARRLFGRLPVYRLLDAARALRAADNYRALRKRGITIRGTVDAVIATFCIDESLPLLFADRDFLPFVRHLGLQPAVRLD